MKRLSILILLFTLIASATAGVIKVTKAWHRVGDAQPYNATLTPSGKPGALVLVQCPLPGAKFDGGGCYAYEDLTGEYAVWVQDGFYMFKMRFPGCLPQIINMQDLGVGKLKAHQVYQIDLDLASLQSASLNPDQKDISKPSNPTPPPSSSPQFTLQPKTFTIPGTNVSFKMMPVEGGSFEMGDTRWEESKPIHTVILDDFMIGETEVTQELWQAVMGINPSRHKSVGPKGPVEDFTLGECQEFIKKINQKLTSQLGGAILRLPTEAEWEYAARGGKKSKGYTYSGSNDINKAAWYTFNSKDNSTHTVKYSVPNELGLYDMSGNVSEWCEDLYDSNFYSRSEATKKNPLNKYYGKSHVVRGGSYTCYDGFCHPCNRYHISGGGGYNFGLRLALQVK